VGEGGLLGSWPGDVDGAPSLPGARAWKLAVGRATMGGAAEPGVDRHPCDGGPPSVLARAARAALAAVLLAPVVLTQQSTVITAVDGTDVGAAGGEAVFSNGWVEFPGPPSRGGGERAGHVAYAFSCVAPSTVAWELSAVLTDGDSDSVLVRVDPPGDEGWVDWHLGGSRSTLEDMEFAWSSRSTSFAVDAGRHSLLIGEREVRRASLPLAPQPHSPQHVFSSNRRHLPVLLVGRCVL
jgi:hypothetical protein